jgi:hypothetical protein
LIETQNPEIETRNKAELLHSLGRLTRGLSALFWGLPTSLVIGVQTVRTDWLRSFGLVPALAATGLLVFGLWQMGDFQKQERPWRNVLDRAKLLALVNFGLCPFLYWHNRLPQESFFGAAVFVLALSAVIFLFNLNVVLNPPARDRTVYLAQSLVARLSAVVDGRLRSAAPRNAHAVGIRYPFRLVQRARLMVAGLLCSVATGHDHGAHLENQRNHLRQRV